MIQKLEKKYSEYKRLVQKNCRKSHDDYVQNLITSGNNNKKNSGHTLKVNVKKIQE